MAKRRKISEISKDMFEIINKKPSAKEIEELAEILNKNEEIENSIDGDDLPIDQIAISQMEKGKVDGHESSRI